MKSFCLVLLIFSAYGYEYSDSWAFFHSLIDTLKSERNSHACLNSDSYDHFDKTLWKKLFSHLGPIQITRNFKETCNLNIIFSKNNLFWKTSINNKHYWNSPRFYIFLNFLNATFADTILMDLWYKYEVYNAFVLFENYFKVFDPTRNVVSDIYSYEREDMKIFFEKRFIDWHQSYAYAVTFERESSLKLTEDGSVKGYEGKILSLLRDKLNLKQIKLVDTCNKSRYGFKYKNGSLGGTFKNLADRSANITAIGHFIKWYNVPELVFSHYISSDNLCIFVSKSGKVSHIIAFMKSLKLTTCLGLILLYIGADFAFVYLQKMECKMKRKAKQIKPFFMVFRIILGIPINLKFYRSYQRFILSSMFLMSFIIQNTFQSSLMTFSSAPLYIKNVETINDLKAAKIEVWLNSLELSSSLKDDKSLAGVKIVQQTLEDTLKANKRDEIGRTLRLNVLLSPKVWDYNGEKTDKPKHIVGECIGTYFAALVFPVGSPYEAPINSLIARLIESGFTKRWIIEAAKNNEAGVTMKMTQTKWEIKSISWNDVLIAFIIYLCGIIGSLLVFITELIVIKFIKNYSGNEGTH